MAVRKSVPDWLQPFLDALARTGNVRVASAGQGWIIRRLSSGGSAMRGFARRGRGW